MKLFKLAIPLILILLMIALGVILPDDTYSAEYNVDLALGGEGSVGWTAQDFKPGMSGEWTLNVSNEGNQAGTVYIWICDFSSWEGLNPESEEGNTAEPGELQDYLKFGVSSSRMESNVTFPALIGDFPQSGSDVRYIIIENLLPGETVTLYWEWALPPETGNEAQGDGLSFKICLGMEPNPQASVFSLVKQGTLDMTIVPPADQANPGDKINYTFTLTNTGDTALTNITVTDPRVTVVGGPLESLAADATDNSTFTGTYTLTQADIDAGKVDNTASAYSTESGPVDNSTTVEIPRVCGLTLEKIGVLHTDVVDPDGQSDVGDIITYTFKVTNTGNITLTNIAITDVSLNIIVEGSPIASLAPGESSTLSGFYYLTQTDLEAGIVRNTAAATSAEGCSDEDDEIIELTLDCTITTASPVCARSGNTASTVAQNADSYVWTVAGGNITGGQGTSTITYLAGSGPTVTIQITVVKDGLTKTCSLSVVVNALPDCTISCNPDCSVCPEGPNSSITLSAPLPPSGKTYTYRWQPGGATTREITVSPTSATTYFLTVTDTASGCSSTCSKLIKISCPIAVGGSVEYEDTISVLLSWIILGSLLLTAGIGITLRYFRKIGN